MRSIAELDPRPASEGARRASADAGASDPDGAPDPEVTERATRRRFTAEYKLRILREVDACNAHGELGALLRREGLYSSHLATWRRQRDEVARAGLAARKRGPKAKVVDPRLKQLERENTRLKRRLEKAETIIEFQKKVSELLEIPLKSPDTDEND